MPHPKLAPEATPSIPLAATFFQPGVTWEGRPCWDAASSPMWGIASTWWGGGKKKKGMGKQLWVPIPPYFSQQLPWQQLLQGEMLHSILVPRRMPGDGASG